jgi:hypothetical protein
MSDNLITKNINGEFKVEYGDPSKNQKYLPIDMAITYLLSQPIETVCLQIYYGNSQSIFKNINEIIHILSLPIDDLALHVNDPEGFCDLVYWRYSLVPNILSTLKFEVSLTL